MKFPVPNTKLFTFTDTGITEAADKALGILKRMKPEKLGKKRVRTELSHLFHFNKKKVDRSKPAWRHTFCCLAYHDQQRIPATDFEKEELYQAGLGEREILFSSLDISQEEFRELLYEYFPRLRDGGGYQLLKGLPNSRSMEVLSMNVHSSPVLLKQCVGTSRTYIRPLQADLDVTPQDEVQTDTVRKSYYIYFHYVVISLWQCVLFTYCN